MPLPESGKYFDHNDEIQSVEQRKLIEDILQEQSIFQVLYLLPDLDMKEDPNLGFYLDVTYIDNLLSAIRNVWQALRQTNFNDDKYGIQYLFDAWKKITTMRKKWTNFRDLNKSQFRPIKRKNKLEQNVDLLTDENSVEWESTTINTKIDSGKSFLYDIDKYFAKELYKKMKANNINDLREYFDVENSEDAFLISALVAPDLDYKTYQLVGTLIKPGFGHMTERKNDFNQLFKALNKVNIEVINKDIGKIFYKKMWDYFYPFYEKSEETFYAELNKIKAENKPLSPILAKILEYFESVVTKARGFSSKNIDGFKEEVGKGNDKKSFDLLPYQKLLLARHANEPNKAFAVDRSLGKTFIMLADALKSGADPILVLCRTSLMGRWAEALATYTDVKTQVIRGKNKKKRMDFISRSEAKVMIGSIDGSSEFDGRNFECVICDEAQHIRNATTKRHHEFNQLIEKIRPKKVIVGSGTAFNNVQKLKDFTSLVSIPSLKILNNLDINNDIEAQKFVFHNLKTHLPMQRKTDVREDKRIWNIHECRMSNEQEELYKDAFDDLRHCEKQEGKIVYSQTALKLFSKLMIISNGLHPDTKEFITNNGKALELDEIVDDSLTNNEKLLIFATDLKVVDELMKRYQARYCEGGDIDIQKMDSTVGSEIRTDLAKRFLEDKSNLKIMIGTPGVMGEGHNLESASTAVLYSLPTNAEQVDQSTDRIDRPDQKKDQVYIKILESVASTHNKTIDYHLRTIFGEYDSFVKKLIAGKFDQDTLNISNQRVVIDVLNRLYQEAFNVFT